MAFQALRASTPIEEFDYQLLISHLGEYSNPRNKISRLIKEGKIIRIKKGLYVFGEEFRKGLVCKEVLANLISGPSYISFEYALSFYGLIPERVEVVTSATMGKSRRFQTVLGTFDYRHVGLKKYPLSVISKELDPHHHVLIATPEKAVIDQLDLAKNLTTRTSIESFFLEDLRMSEEDLKQLSIAELKEITAHYSAERMKRAVKFIERIQSHA